MKKIILKPKAIMLTFLFLGILAILVPLTVVLGFTGKNSNQSSWQIDPYTSSGPINLISNGADDVNICLRNNSAYSYFIPYKTSVEWYYFKLKKITQDGDIVPYICCGDGLCQGSEDYSNCSADCAPPVSQCGDGICGDGETSLSCPGDCPGACLDSTGSAIPAGAACTNSLGSNNYCQADGIYSYYSTGTGYIIDTYCRTSTSALACTHYNGCSWFNTLGPGQGPINLYCGDHVCNSSIGENCSSCLNDCGGCPACGLVYCPASCGDGTCSGGETCSSCAQDCGGCSGGMCVGPAGCSSRSSQIQCVHGAGCTWLDNPAS